MRLTAEETRRWLDQLNVTLHATGEPCALPVTGGSLIVDAPSLRAAWKITLARIVIDGRKVTRYDVETIA